MGENLSRIAPESKVRQSPDAVARELSPSEGGVLLHLKTAQYHGLNPVGLLIWELLDGERTVSDVVDAVRARVEDAPPELEGEVLSFLNDVHERGLVQVD
jgi:Coenzyme PQQ synthesis protein D (PqqD)